MNEARKQTIYIVLAILALSLLPGLFDDAEAAEVYVEVHGLSYHQDRDAGFNERNTGVGISVRDDGLSYGLGGYDNSEYNQSYYAFVGKYKRFRYADVGIDAGVVTGYKRMDPAPFVIPYFKTGPLKFRMIPFPEPVVSVSVEVPIN